MSAWKPDPKTGRMDHHQLGTGRYQSSITVEVPTTSDIEVCCEFYPVPPSYSVATSLPTYDEAEKAKAVAMATCSSGNSSKNSGGRAYTKRRLQ
ncbi:NEDD4 family-interacting protein 2 [Sigmodon hispidus]